MAEQDKLKREFEYALALQARHATSLRTLIEQCYSTGIPVVCINLIEVRVWVHGNHEPILGNAYLKQLRLTNPIHELVIVPKDHPSWEGLIPLTEIASIARQLVPVDQDDPEQIKFWPELVIDGFRC